MSSDSDGSSVTEHFRAPNGRYSTSEAEIRRLDQVYSEAARAHDRLDAERDRRLDDRFEAQETATQAALVAADKATNVALTAADKATGKAEASQQALISAQAAEIKELRSRLDVGPPSLHTLQARSDTDAGRRAGGMENRALLFSIIAALASAVAVLGIIMAVGPR